MTARSAMKSNTRICEPKLRNSLLSMVLIKESREGWEEAASSRLIGSSAFPPIFLDLIAHCWPVLNNEENTLARPSPPPYKRPAKYERAQCLDCYTLVKHVLSSPAIRYNAVIKLSLLEDFAFL